MNAKVVLKAILVVVMLASLSGCANLYFRVELDSPPETRESNFEIQTPTGNGIDLLPTNEPVSSTPKPKPTFTQSEPTVEILHETDMVVGGQELIDANTGKYRDTNVTLMLGSFTGTDITIFENSIQEFEKNTGIDIRYEGIPIDHFETEIYDRVLLGNPPDIAEIYSPSLLRAFTSRGEVLDLNHIIDRSWLEENYNQSWLDMATMEGPSGSIMAGIWTQAGIKSLVWYPKDDFDKAGYEIPTTWDELLSLTNQIVEDGGTPWCIGIESGTATGWPVTDWIEDIMLRTTSVENYDRWVQGELSFDSPEVRRSIEYMTNIWFNDDYVFRGRSSISKIFYGDAPKPLFEKPPKCWLYRQASFITGFFPVDSVAGRDYDFFLLPSIDPIYGRPVLATGRIMAAFHDRPEVRAVMQYFSTGDSVKGWVRPSTVSIHNDSDLKWYQDPITRKQAYILRNADTIRFDGSDLMPGSVGGGSFWEEMTAYVNGDVNLDDALRKIDATWPR